MGSRRSPPRSSLVLPGEDAGRRHFLRNGLIGAALLAVGGGAWLGTRRTVPLPAPAQPFEVFSAQEAAVLLAIANRMVPERPRFPRPADLALPQKMDAIAAMADPITQQELRRLVRLFESALAGFVLDGQPRLFTASSPAQQDRRLHAWARSRVGVRRTGYRALKHLVYGAYYASPESWSAIGYPGPPLAPARRGGTPPSAPAVPAATHDDR